MAGPFSFTCACASGHRLQIYRRIFAATINLKLELQPITLIEVGHASAFDRRDMHECIRLPVVTLYEAKAFHCVEELDRAGCLFAGQLTLRSAAISTTIAAAVALFARRAAVFDRHRFTVDLEIGCRNPAATIHQRELKRLTISKAGQTGLLDRRNMDEHVFTAVIANDEAEAFLTVEELYDALAFADDLRWHAATAARATTAAAKTAAAATAAEAITAAEATATAAETITTVAAATAAAKLVSATKSAEAFVSETIALIPATALPAAPTIKTHAVLVFLNVAQYPCKTRSRALRANPKVPGSNMAKTHS